MALIELVDFNDTYVNDKPTKKRSRRRGGKNKAEIAKAAVEGVTEEVAASSEAEEVVVKETPTPEASSEQTEAAEPSTEEVAEDTTETTSKADENQEDSKGDKQK
jgi:hypothetical protein